MKRTVTTAAIIGFAVPIFWGIVSFITFTAPESAATEFYWDVVHVTCPPWLIPESSVFGSPLATPFVNAALYAGIVVVAYGLKHLKRVLWN